MEAARLGFTVAVVPEQNHEGPGTRGPLEIPGLHVHAVPDVDSALRAVAQAAPSRRPPRRSPPLTDF
jgi:hypothetical protein